MLTRATTAIRWMGIVTFVAAALLTSGSSLPRASAVHDIVLLGFDVAPDLMTVRLQFAGADGLAVRGEMQETPIHGGVAVVAVELDGHSEITQRRFHVVSSTFGELAWLHVEYYPQAYYRSIGVRAGGVLQLVTDLPRAVSTDLAQQVWQSTPESYQLAVARTQWQDIAHPTAGRPSSLTQTVRAFFEFLDQHNVSNGRQLCSDRMPTGQMRAAITRGDCYAWCTGQAAMLRDVLRTAGYPTRRVFLNAAVTTLANGVTVQASEQHASVELYANGRWRWIDPTFRIWAARGASGDALSLRRVIMDLADPEARRNLQFAMLGPSPSEDLHLVDVTDAPPAVLSGLSRYLTSDKQLSIEGPPRSSSSQ